MKHATVPTLVMAVLGIGHLSAQTPVESEVRQLVTFTFLPGQGGDALSAYRDQAVPLYERNEAMLSFRGFREVESPVPLDLIVVSAFKGMSGMDRSNQRLRALAAEAGTSIGAIYGELGAMSSSHTDQFVEMAPALGNGDPSARRLTALIWYRIERGQAPAFEAALSRSVAPWERANGIATATGRFLVSDGWHYLRFIGVDSLGAYQDYWARLADVAGYERLSSVTVARKEVIVASIPDMAVR